jgi:hypothetical protein
VFNFKGSFLRLDVHNHIALSPFPVFHVKIYAAQELRRHAVPAALTVGSSRPLFLFCHPVATQYLT